MCFSSENALEEWVHNRLGRKLAEDLSRELLLLDQQHILSLPPQDEVASNCNRNRRRLFRLTALPVLTIRSMCLSSENAQEEWVHNRLGRKLAEDLSRQLLLVGDWLRVR
ncbi:hypothetical protein CDAR_5351 [Caerostris darwini]|uniref:Uncharacterized protein n=1 Tax=Caerostris darwini TaxID=1538125 RepID=A0AAV4RA98_9ARAC|nr:hypothetical protein CDAR_5351 [Caerostris darwini]